MNSGVKFSFQLKLYVVLDLQSYGFLCTREKKLKSIEKQGSKVLSGNSAKVTLCIKTN